ncbi:hypothetical protein [Fluviicola chungangensis]|uniref:DUF3630 family protein n=1 Tax=Fluviicola chungangensis TaxID=2597671 RepID=A0A556N2S4_9FLAO|nr:hypothetical protein [Fluviicola chungangensis]TSJ46375.1 hypothetical protein FO442_04250 [Fluviicola chungangensis]
MENPIKYSYKLRPGYGSDELLIELDGKDQPDELQTDLILILEQNGFKLTELKDIWQNDEWSFIFRSQQGVVLLSRDTVWDFFFLMGENNQADILKLDEILSKNPLFEKLNVNNSDYQ